MGKGRKRKPGPRYPSGDLKPAIDRGTPELQSRRKFDAGEGDPNLTCTILGILRANDQITEDEYQSACDYRKLFAIVYRKPEISAGGGAIDGSGGIISDDKLIQFREDLRRLERAIARVVGIKGRIAKDTWDNLVLYGRRPRWMCAVFPRSSDIRDADLFRAVLREVTGACGRGEKVAA